MNIDSGSCPPAGNAAKQKSRRNRQHAQLLRTIVTIEADIRAVAPARSISGSLAVPGDKSISHRYAMLAAIAEGETSLTNFSTGADCGSTLECLRQLGADIQRDSQGVLL